MHIISPFINSSAYAVVMTDIATHLYQLYIQRKITHLYDIPRYG